MPEAAEPAAESRLMITARSMGMLDPKRDTDAPAVDPPTSNAAPTGDTVERILAAHRAATGFTPCEASRG